MELSGDQTRRLADRGVAAVWLFGSRVTGRPRPDSDVDLAVLLTAYAARPGLLARGVIADVLAQATGTADIDLVVLDEAPLPLQARVVAEGTLIADIDPPRRVRFVVETLSRWGDVRRSVDEQDRAYLRRIAQEGLAR